MCRGAYGPETRRRNGRLRAVRSTRRRGAARSEPVLHLMHRRPRKGTDDADGSDFIGRRLTPRGMPAAVAALVAAVALAGCGSGQKAVQPILNAAQTGRDAQAFSSLEQAIVTVALVRSEAGGSAGTGADDLAARLQGRSPSVHFAATPSGGPEEVQVVGGGPQPVMLVAKSQSGSY